MELPDEKGWDAVGREQAAEKTRCAAIVKLEIDAGVRKGIPITSGAMVVLHRILAAIENG